MKAYLSSLSLPGALPDESPLPYYRDQKRHREARSDGTLRSAELEKMGWELAFRVLPYHMQDVYSRKRVPITLKTVVLENDCLRAEFLPDMGGRLLSLFDKQAQRELLYVNPVMQPANLGIRNAWFSGGIEWNLGRTGHTYFTCAPVFFARLQDEEGHDFLRLYEYERCEGICFSIDFHLPPGARALIAHVNIFNVKKDSIPMYWWTNIAVQETPGSRVLSGASDVVYIQAESVGLKTVHTYGHATMPDIPSIPGLDASYPENSHYSNEYFYQTPQTEMFPWEAYVYPEGWTFMERSTALLRYRKMFCWGNHAGGRRWKSFLSTPGTGDYVEVQAGLAPTQLHGMEMPGDTAWTFTQAFSGIDCDPDWSRLPYGQAVTTVGEAMEQHLSEAFISEQDKRCRKLFDRPIAEFLSMGSGWGALESLRRSVDKENPLPLEFPQSSLTQEQIPWLSLLQTGCMPQAPSEVPGLSYLVDPAWLRHLSDALEKDPENDTALLHKGIALYETNQVEEAQKAWERALALRPTALTLYNLSLCSKNQGDLTKALSYMERALEMLGKPTNGAYFAEYIRLLLDLSRGEEVLSLLSACEDMDDRLCLLYGEAAAQADRVDLLDDAFFAREYAYLREGENMLTELWFWREARRMADARGVAMDEALLQEAMATCVPPQEIDFRMFPS